MTSQYHGQLAINLKFFPYISSTESRLAVTFAYFIYIFIYLFLNLFVYAMLSHFFGMMFSFCSKIADCLYTGLLLCGTHFLEFFVIVLQLVFKKTRAKTEFGIFCSFVQTLQQKKPIIIRSLFGFMGCMY